MAETRSKADGNKREGPISVVLEVRGSVRDATNAKKALEELAGVKVNLDSSNKKLTVMGKVDLVKIRKKIKGKNVVIVPSLPNRDKDGGGGRGGGRGVMKHDKQEKVRKADVMKPKEGQHPRKRLCLQEKSYDICQGAIVGVLNGVEHVEKDLVTVKGAKDAKTPAVDPKGKLKPGVENDGGGGN